MCFETSQSVRLIRLGWIHFGLGTVSEGKEVPQHLQDRYEWHNLRQCIIFNNPHSAYEVHVLRNKGEYEAMDTKTSLLQRACEGR